MGLRIVAEVVDQVAPVHVEHGTDGHEGAEADILPQAPVEHCSAERATLADESHVTGPGDSVGEGRVQAADRIHRAQAVGADEPHLAADSLGNLPLQFFAVLAEFLEASRDDDAGRNTQLHGFGDDTGDGVGRRYHHDQVHLVGQVSQAGVSLDPEHIGALGIHRKNRAAEGAPEQVPQHRAAYATGTLGSPDHGNALGEKKRIKGVASGAGNFAGRAWIDRRSRDFDGRNRGHKRTPTLFLLARPKRHERNQVPEL